MHVMRLPHRIERVWDGFVSDRNLLRMEQEFIDKTDCVNVNRAFSTEEETRARHNAEERARYHANKQQIRNRLNEKITCQCGMSICRGGMKRHLEKSVHIILGEKEKSMLLRRVCSRSTTLMALETILQGLISGDDVEIEIYV